MDLSGLISSDKSDAGVDMQLRHPVTNEPLIDEASKEPVVITLLGKDSREYASRQHANVNKLLRNMPTGDAMLTRGVVTAEQADADQLNLLIGCTKGWRHIDLNKKSLLFNEENVRVIYAVKWIREQAIAFIANRANFLGN